MSMRNGVRNISSLIVITLPIYKDTAYLEKATESLEEISALLAQNFLILIAEDGSNSSDVVDRLAQRYKNLVYFQNDQRLGRGRALREAWKKVSGDIYVYIDVDMATDLTKLDAYKHLLEGQNEADLVTGSRYVRGASIDRPWLRKTASIAYNWIIRILFQTGVHDHQCGFKSFSRKLVERLNEDAKSDSWFWDTEVVVLAKRFGFKIKEIPVHWVEKKGRRTPIRRLLSDVCLHGAGLVTLFFRVHFS
jgi:glycosyltransferase involved in cell wall biosynthesis